MKERIVTGIVLVAVVFGFLFFDSDYLFGVGVFLVTLVSAYEWLKLAKIDQQSIFKNLIIFTIVVFVVAQFFIYL
ncbi:phosphatidate cytidylyltransferase, partial [Francisella tularensis subsp. holarctica]|uniref:phosphatidate cytidylyltransferase n=1 Tax=Francisella tularensis TaxID=263 RepID=UPI002381C1A8